MLEEYNIGRGTLRESLRFLELQGVLTLKPGPGGGPVVQQPDSGGLAISIALLLQFQRAPFRTIAEARSALEPMMARLAARRMDDVSIDKLRNNVEAMKESVDDQRVFIRYNKEFHQLIAHGSGNVMFGFLIDALLGMLDGTAVGIDYPRPRREAVCRAHERVFQAIEKHDDNDSHDRMLDHIREYVRYAERKFPELLDAPIVWSTID